MIINIELRAASAMIEITEDGAARPRLRKEISLLKIVALAARLRAQRKICIIFTETNTDTTAQSTGAHNL